MSEQGTTLSVCMIVKDVEDCLGDCLRSLPSWIHELVIADTGSTDGTKEIAKKFGAKVYDYEDPDPIEVDGVKCLGNFAAARNFAFDQCTGDYVIWIDSDDVLWEKSPGTFLRWFQKLCTEGKKDGVWMSYDYEHSEDGECTMQHGRERIVKRGEWTWRSPIHEVLCHNFEAVNGGSIPDTDCRIIHVSLGDHKHEFRAKRNALVAEKAIAAEGGRGEPRIHLNLANSYMALKRYEEAIQNFRIYLEGSEWNGEKAMVHISIADCLQDLGEMDLAQSEILQAIALEPMIKEPYIKLADHKLRCGDNESAIHWADQAIGMERDNRGYKHNPMFLEAKPLEIKSFAYMQTGEMEKAKECAESLLKKYPYHREAKVHLSVICNILRQRDAVDAYKKVETLILRERDADKLDLLRRAAPEMVASDIEVRLPPDVARDPSKKRICIHCGEGFTTWGPSSIVKGGIGGSETAVIKMAYELRDLGWHVEVYAFPRENEEGDIDGVHWYPYWRMPSNVRYDVFVNWRTPYLSMKRPEALLSVVWLHDVQYESRWSKEAIDAYDKVMVLSEAHRKNVDFLPDEKIIISRNGIDASFFEEWKDEPRIPKRMVYASCPSRGLVHIADNWSRIREAHPDAEIDVFYGFNEPFREQMQTNKYFRDVYERCQRFFRQDGVNYHGMVDQRTLGRAFARASVWAYPCHFPEISCITSMQAQVSGAYPVTTGFWALSETTRFGHVVGGPEDNIAEEEGLRERWVDTLIEELSEPTVNKEQVEEARKHHLWSEVAKEWDSTFKTLMRQPSKDLVASTTD